MSVGGDVMAHFFVDLLWQEGVSPAFINVAETSLRNTLVGFGLADRVSVEPMGTWRAADYLSADGSLVRERSVDALIHYGREMSERSGLSQEQVLTNYVNLCLGDRPWRSRDQDGFAVLLLRDDCVCPGEEYIFGAAREGSCAVLSTYRYERDPRIQLRLETFAATVCHEFGHVLGAPNDLRTEAVQQWVGTHCTNVCVMRQRDDLPEWESDIAKDFLDGKVFCALCVRDIRDYLSHRMFG